MHRESLRKSGQLKSRGIYFSLEQLHFEYHIRFVLRDHPASRRRDGHPNREVPKASVEAHALNLVDGPTGITSSASRCSTRPARRRRTRASLAATMGGAPRFRRSRGARRGAREKVALVRARVAWSKG